MRTFVIVMVLATASSVLCVETGPLCLGQSLQISPSLPDKQTPVTPPRLPDDALFADPPLSSTLAPQPTLDEQRHIMARVVDYVSTITHRLPNFYADRTTTHLEDWPMGYEAHNQVPARYIRPHVVSIARARVTYRDGKENAEPLPRKHHRDQAQYGLETWGLFGPILATVMIDAGRNTLVWSGWTRGATGPLAVFHYSVPMETSGYEVRFCCVPVVGVLSTLDRRSAYHGTIVVEPDTGVILQLTVLADLDQGDLPTLIGEAEEGTPLQRADVWIQYGPVEIAGKSYTLPLKSVAISRARTVVQKGRQSMTLGPLKTFINETSFASYHVFRSESRIITPGNP